MNFQLPLPFTVDDVILHMLDNHGVDPTGLYCAVTGRPYGYLGTHELEETIRFLDNDDLESFCDDLFVRMIAGMRPCLNWSRVEPVTIEFARHHDKAGLLSYLINRCNESKPSADTPFSELMERNQRRIKTYALCYDLTEKVDTFELTQLLLQADSFGNLHRFNAPKWSDKIERPERLFHESHLTPDNYPALVEKVRAWVESILVILEKESRVAMSDARSAATYGNRLTSMAYQRSWFENPVSALTPEARKRQESKADGTWQSRVKKQTKKAIKQAEVDSLFASVEAMLTNSETTEPKESLASKIARSSPPKKVGFKFGVKQ